MFVETRLKKFNPDSTKFQDVKKIMFYKVIQFDKMPLNVKKQDYVFQGYSAVHAPLNLYFT